MKKHSKKFLLVSLTLIYLATAAVGLIQPRVANAAPVINIHNLDPQQQMTTFMLAATLVQCAAAHGLAESNGGNDIAVPEGNADTGAWFDSGGVDVGLANIGLPESDYVQGNPRYYQQLACENSDWVNKAVTALGYEAQGNIPADRVALCDLATGSGSSFFARSGGGDCLSGSGDYGYNPGTGDKSFSGGAGSVKSDVAQAFENVLEARLGLAKGALQHGGDMPSGPAMYLYWYAYFTTPNASYSCEAVITPGATGNQAYQDINYIDDNGDLKSATFKSTDGKNQGSDVKYAVDLGGENTKKCGVSSSDNKSVAYIVNLNAPLMAKYIATHPDFKINAQPRDPANSQGNQSCGTTADGVSENCADTTLNCGSGVLNWLVCPLINIALKAGQAMDNLIMNNLNTDAKPIFDDPTNGFYQAWSSFRLISTAVIIIAGLIMVISQALGFELLDAYTIRKTLPRLFIAIVGISLSWPLMHFVVVLFDTIGFDIRSLIYSPFSTITHQISPGAGILLQIAGPLIAIVALGPVVLTFLLTAGLAIFVGLMVLIVRQIAIIMLIIVAPIAIACYVLPNTQKVWKLWSQNFLGLMLAFPIISALIAAGHVFALVSTGPTSNVFSQIIGFIAYFLPYFLIPVALRMATGVIGSIAGFVNDRNRGIFDRLKKKRGETMSRRMGQLRNNTLYSNSSRLGRIANKVGGAVVAPASNAAYYGRRIPGFKRAGAKIAGQIDSASVDQSGKLFEEINKLGGMNDKAYRAMSGMHYGFNENIRRELKSKGLYGKAPTSFKDLQEVGRIMSTYGEGTELIGGNAISTNAGRLSTLFQDPEMSKANIAATGILGLAAHGFASTRDLANSANLMAGGKLTPDEHEDENGVMRDFGNVTTGSKERTGYAGSVIAQAQQLGARSRPDGKNGYGVMYDAAQGKFLDGVVSAANGGGGRALDVIRSLDSDGLAGAKPGAFDSLAPAINEILDGGGPNAQAVEDQIFSWAGPYSRASVDVKARAIQLIQERGARESQTDAGRGDNIATRFDRYRRAEVSPNARDGRGEPQEPPAAAGPGGGGR